MSDDDKYNDKYVYKYVEMYWHENYSSGGICRICNNCGYINSSGVVCICPIGRAIKESDEKEIFK